MNARTGRSLRVAALVAALVVPAAAHAAPVTLSNPGVNATGPVLAASHGGEALAVWAEGTGGAQPTVASKQAGAGWSSPTPLAGPGAVATEVSMNGDGVAAAWWLTGSTTPMSVHARLRTAAGTWAAAEDLPAQVVATEPDADIVIDDAGNLTATWTHDDAGHTRVQASSKPVGGTWSTPVDLSAAGSDAKYATVAVSGDGDAVAMWTVGTGGNRTLQSAQRPATGTWSAPVDVATGLPDKGIALTTDGAGNVVVAWPETATGITSIKVASRPAAASGTWSAAATLTQGAPASTADQPTIAVNADGAAVAAWRYITNASNAVPQAATKPAGGAWSAPVDLEAAPVSGASPAPRSYIDPQGNATVLFNGGTTDAPAARVSRHQAGGDWAATGTLVANARSPRMVSDESGNSLYLWESTVSAEHAIQADGELVAPLVRQAPTPKSKLRLTHPSREAHTFTMRWAVHTGAARYVVRVRFSDGQGIKRTTTATRLVVRPRTRVGLRGRIRYSVVAVNASGHRMAYAKRRIGFARR